MKKRIYANLLCVAMGGVMAVAGVACKGGKNDGFDFDPTKTAIRAFTFSAGYGTRWLDEVIANFEEAYKDVSFEEGKTGVQVKYLGDMKEFSAVEAKASSYDVFFLENADYYELAKGGALLDISSAVTSENTDGKTIESKLTEQQQNYFGVAENGGKVYYGLPHYMGSYGLIYNRELFNKNCYYFNDDGEFIDSLEDTKSKGPDGEAGTFDDGLPATYDEFFKLCQQVHNDSLYAVSWPGKHYQQHLSVMMDNLASDYSGIDEALLNYTFSGGESTVIKLDANGKVVKNNGVPETERIAISSANGYDASRQAGKYYAMDFIYRLVSNKDYYNDKNAKSTTCTHTQNQRDFIAAGTGYPGSFDGIAILADGAWWEAESAAASEAIAQKLNDESLLAKNREFAWMPFPKANESKIGSKNVLNDTVNAIMCARTGLTTNKEAVLKFIQFCNTDENLVKFTQTTGALKGLKYSFTDEQLATLSPYARSYAQYAATADILYSYSGTPFYYNNQQDLMLRTVYTATYNGVECKYPVTAMWEHQATAESYLEAYYQTRKSKLFWA